MLRYDLSSPIDFLAPIGRSAGAMPAIDRSGGRSAREGGWLESSWDLNEGLEISDLGGDLPEEFFKQLTTPGR